MRYERETTARLFLLVGHQFVDHLFVAKSENRCAENTIPITIQNHQAVGWDPDCFGIFKLQIYIYNQMRKSMNKIPSSSITIKLINIYI